MKFSVYDAKNVSKSINSIIWIPGAEQMENDRALPVVQKYVTSNAIDIVLIQETRIHQQSLRGLGMESFWEQLIPGTNHPQVCILAKKILNMLLLWELCTRDLLVARIRMRVRGNERDLIWGKHTFHMISQDKF